MHKHIRHTPVDEIEWFKCDECEYKCKEKGNLKRHKRLRHTPVEEIEWFKCEECEFKAKLAGVLK
jgi:general transcription factor IIIA